MDLGPFRIAGFTGLNQLLGFAKSRGVDEDHVLSLGLGQSGREAWRGFYHSPEVKSLDGDYGMERELTSSTAVRNPLRPNPRQNSISEGPNRTDCRSRLHDRLL
jgi:hypothetical protein